MPPSSITRKRSLYEDNPSSVRSLLFVHLATAYNNKGDQVSAITHALEALRINADPSVGEPSIAVYAHKQLVKAYRNLGFKYGYDMPLLLRDIYSTEKLAEANPEFSGDYAPSIEELRSLVALVDQLENLLKHFNGATVFPGELSDLGKGSNDEVDKFMVTTLGRAGVTKGLELPDDGIPEAEKAKALDKLRKRAGY